jgi:DNA-binding transcriptional LysR family regulator
VTKLGRLHVYPFAARSYVDRYGLPRDKSDMVHHRLVQQAAPQINADAWARLLGVDSVENIVGLRSNASSAVFYAVERGAGIGALPTYACALDAAVIPVDIGIHLADLSSRRPEIQTHCPSDRLGEKHIRPAPLPVVS